MDKTEEAIRRGEEARQLIEHPLMVEAFQSLDQSLFETWLQTKDSDVDARERIYRMVRTVRSAAVFLAGVLADGKIAAARLEDIKRARGESEPEPQEYDDFPGTVRTYMPGGPL